MRWRNSMAAKAKIEMKRKRNMWLAENLISNAMKYIWRRGVAARLAGEISALRAWRRKAENIRNRESLENQAAFGSSRNSAALRKKAAKLAGGRGGIRKLRNIWRV